MRNVKAMIKEGRNDPASPQQKREHPYDFISFPEGGKKNINEKRLEHTMEMDYNGRAVFEIKVLTPLHIGSGIYELSEDIGFDKGSVVRGIVKVNSKPIIPGSSLKGASRSVYEAVTKSCIRLYDDRQNEKIHPQKNKSKLPQEFVNDFGFINPQYGKTVTVELDKRELRSVDTCREIKYVSDMANNLCPSCALYGSMGYQGRLSFGDCKIVSEGKKGQPLAIPSLTNPQMHRVGKINVDRGKIRIDHIEGRKFYYKSEIVPGTNENGNELVDYIPQETLLQFEMFFRNCTEAELGGILCSFAIGEDFTARLGGGKPIGMGEVKIRLVELEYHKNAKENFTSFSREKQKVDNIEGWISQVKSKFKEWNCFYSKGLEELKTIVNTKQDINKI